MERFHSYELNQCIGGLGRFLSKELNQGSVDFKPMEDKGIIRLCMPHQKKKKKRRRRRKLYLEIYEKPWKYHGKIKQIQNLH